MMDIGLSDRIRDVLSFGVGEHRVLAACLRAYCTVELDLEIIDLKV